MNMETKLPVIESACEVSVIIPVMSRDDGAEAIWSAYQGAMLKTGKTFEFIYVLDGPHATYVEALERLGGEQAGIRIVSLNRSFGEAACIQEGVRQARSDRLLILPAHLQVVPESIATLLELSESYDVVTGARDRRQDTAMSRWRGKVFNMFASFAGSKFEDPGCTARVVRRHVFDELHLQSDQHFFLPLLAERLGFSVKQVLLEQAEIDRRFRAHRPTDYVTRLMDVVGLAFMTRFMHKPFRFFGTIGASLLMLGLLCGLYVVAQRNFGQIPLADRPALLLTVLLIVLGIQVGAVGLMAEIVIFTRYRTTPAYRIDRIVAQDDDA
jgi:glycosyltransferase involved in cell wall biosynthesis